MQGNVTQITPNDVPEFESPPIDKAKVMIQMKYVQVNIEWLLAIFEIYHQLSPLQAKRFWQLAGSLCYINITGKNRQANHYSCLFEQCYLFA